jgi:hypothetical protein
MSRAFEIGRAERYRTHAGKLLGKRGGSGSEHFVCLFRFLKVDLGIKRCLVDKPERSSTVRKSRQNSSGCPMPLANRRLRHGSRGGRGRGQTRRLQATTGDGSLPSRWRYRVRGSGLAPYRKGRLEERSKKVKGGPKGG